MRWVWKPVLIACIGLTAFFSAAVVQAANELILVSPASGQLNWLALEPFFPAATGDVQTASFSINAQHKGEFEAYCSVIRDVSTGAILPNDRLVYSYEGSAYTPFSSEPAWGLIYSIPGGGTYSINVNLAPLLQEVDRPGTYEADISFRFTPRNGKLTIITMRVSIQVSQWAHLSVTPIPISLINPGLPDLEVCGQAQVAVTSFIDWQLQISCSNDFSSGSATILPNQIQFSTDLVNWRPLTADPQWSNVWSGTGNMTLTLYFKVDSFLPFEAGIYDGSIALRAVPSPGS